MPNKRFYLASRFSLVMAAPLLLGLAMVAAAAQADFGLEIIASDSATFKGYIDSETRFWRTLIANRGLKLD